MKSIGRRLGGAGLAIASAAMSLGLVSASPASAGTALGSDLSCVTWQSGGYAYGRCTGSGTWQVYAECDWSPFSISSVPLLQIDSTQTMRTTSSCSNGIEAGSIRIIKS